MEDFLQDVEDGALPEGKSDRDAIGGPMQLVRRRCLGEDGDLEDRSAQAQVATPRQRGNADAAIGISNVLRKRCQKNKIYIRKV